VPAPPVLLIVLPALALVVGLSGIMFWVRHTSRALEEKKRQEALAAAQKKSN